MLYFQKRCFLTAQSAPGDNGIGAMDFGHERGSSTLGSRFHVSSPNSSIHPPLPSKVFLFFPPGFTHLFTNTQRLGGAGNPPPAEQQPLFLTAGPFQCFLCNFCTHTATQSGPKHCNFPAIFIQIVSNFPMAPAPNCKRILGNTRASVGREGGEGERDAVAAAGHKPFRNGLGNRSRPHLGHRVTRVKRRARFS